MPPTHYHLHDKIPTQAKPSTMLAYMAQNYEPIAREYNRLKTLDWRVIVKDIDRGFCNQHDKLIVIPLWAFKHTNHEFPIYYLAHELAHVDTELDTPTAPHGTEWRAKFMQLCPKNLVKYDLNYRLGETQHGYHQYKDE